MRYGNYSVLILEGVERESGYVGLPHGTQYTLRLINHDHRRCDTEVTLDGKPVGTFRLDARGGVTLERSPDDHGRFTFYAAGTPDAAKADEAGVRHEDKGLVQVRFVPERRYVGGTTARVGHVKTVGLAELYAGGGVCRSAPAHAPFAEEKTSGGITGLSGHSDQRFVDAGPIDRDEGAAVTITLRLVTRDDGPRPLRSSRMGNAVPPPVG